MDLDQHHLLSGASYNSPMKNNVLCVTTTVQSTIVICTAEHRSTQCPWLPSCELLGDRNLCPICSCVPRDTNNRDNLSMYVKEKGEDKGEKGGMNGKRKEGGREGRKEGLWGME